MIKSVRSNNSLFNTVKFHNGFNVILADRSNAKSEDETKKTRNGLGKTTLVEIIHFCLGASVLKGSVLKAEELKGWSFTLDVNVNGNEFELERFVDDTSKIYIYGDITKLNWEFKVDKNGNRYLSPKDLSEQALGLFFGMGKDVCKYFPSFRELISYMARRNIDGFRDAFEFWKNQKSWSRQVCNAFFLNLNIQIASSFQELKDKTKGIDDYKNAVKAGVIGDFTLETGRLNTELATQKADMEEIKRQLDSFHVHPRYSDIADTANGITEEIHRLSNTLVIRQQLLTRYEDNLQEESAVISVAEIEKIYSEAGALFGNNLKTQLCEVLEFHNAILTNRKEYLKTEISGLVKEIGSLKSKIKELTARRADSLKILENHGALEEHTAMQGHYVSCAQIYEDTKKRLEAADYITNRKSEIKIETQELLLRARKDYAERIKARDKAILIFRKNTEALYAEHGTLTIDLKETGYEFGVEIKSASSQGINYMKVFCYDMLIAELGIERKAHPDFLIHDSTIFDGVDERQIAKALMLAYAKSDELKFQYIVLLNSDTIPTREFDEGFDEKFNASIVLRLHDETDEGGLLGIHF